MASSRRGAGAESSIVVAMLMGYDGLRNQSDRTGGSANDRLKESTDRLRHDSAKLIESSLLHRHQRDAIAARAVSRLDDSGVANRRQIDAVGIQRIKPCCGLCSQTVRVIIAKSLRFRRLKHISSQPVKRRELVVKISERPWHIEIPHRRHAPLCRVFSTSTSTPPDSEQSPSSPQTPSRDGWISQPRDRTIIAQRPSAILWQTSRRLQKLSRVDTAAPSKNPFQPGQILDHRRQHHRRFPAHRSTAVRHDLASERRYSKSRMLFRLFMTTQRFNSMLHHQPVGGATGLRYASVNDHLNTAVASEPCLHAGS